MNYKNYPIVKLLLPYLFGILVAYFCPIFACFTNHLLLVSLLFLLLSLLFYRIFGYKRQWIAGLFLQCCVILYGISSTTHRLSPPTSYNLEEIIAEETHWIITLSEIPVEKENSVKCVANIQRISPESNISEKAVLYFRKNTTTSSLQYGDRLIANTRLTLISPPKNPYSFDYKKYMERKGVRLTGFIDSCKFEVIGAEILWPVKQWSAKIQRKLSTQFAVSGLAGDEYSVITAILLGNDESMNPELRSQYSAAGVSHILCVSGMHVGIIFMILNFLLRPLDFSRRTKILKAILLLLSIWSYAHITGLAPSVQRAAAMFTFVTVGDLLRRNTNVFHSLFASLFILLAINPLLIFEVGFQLSYAAVFGIVIFQKPIVNLWKAPNRIILYFWELATVSISAQLGTFPLSIYYFGQFPNYFLLANLLVIMLSFIVVVSGVSLLVLSFSTLISGFVGKILTLEIKLMNGIIGFIEQLPGAITENINLHFSQLIILLAILFFLGLFVLHPRKRLILYGYGLFALLPVISLFSSLEKREEVSVTFYALSKRSAINFNYHGKSILVHNFMKDKTDPTYQFHIKTHEQKRDIASHLLSFDEDRRDPGIQFLKMGNHIVFRDHTFLICRKETRFYKNGTHYSVEYLVLCDGCKMKPEQIEEVVSFQKVIIDESVTPYYEKMWIEYCNSNGFICNSMRENGGAIYNE